MKNSTQHLCYSQPFLLLVARLLKNWTTFATSLEIRAGTKIRIASASKVGCARIGDDGIHASGIRLLQLKTPRKQIWGLYQVHSPAMHTVTPKQNSTWEWYKTKSGNLQVLIAMISTLHLILSVGTATPT